MTSFDTKTHIVGGCIRIDKILLTFGKIYGIIYVGHSAVLAFENTVG